MATPRCIACGFPVRDCQCFIDKTMPPPPRIFNPPLDARHGCQITVTRADAPTALPPMPPEVRRLVECLQSVSMAKFPDLCGTPAETKINNAIAAVRLIYRSEP